MRLDGFIFLRIIFKDGGGGKNLTSKGKVNPFYYFLPNILLFFPKKSFIFTISGQNKVTDSFLILSKAIIILIPKLPINIAEKCN